tara:strand:- start:4659 stop:5588 length:930 start_codon:yes stop_codon:yes gene_type:complete
MNNADSALPEKLSQATALLAAIARDGSFSKAAERLGVHQSAISHRVRGLEEALGMPLFERTTRKLSLTDAGEILCAAATRSMAEWEAAVDQLRRNRDSDVIRLSLPSSLAMKWLLPALPRAAGAGLDIAIDVADGLVDFSRRQADAAIRFGPGPYPGLHATRLSSCHLQPVAAAGFDAGGRDIAGLVAAQGVIFLGDRRGEADDTGFSWKGWFTGTGLTMTDFTPGQTFDRADLMLQAAIAGAGIGLGRSLLIEADIRAGFLQPLGKAVPMRSAYWLVCTPAFAATERHARLLKWLKQEVERTTGSLLR